MEYKRPTVGFALSGAGNRSSFYIGFLEVLQEHEVPVDFIAAASGGSLVAAAYACGTLSEFKEWVLQLNPEQLKDMMGKGSNGGIYSLDRVENQLKTYFTRGLNFEDVHPHMSFVAVDIESGELVDLCMGDIARAACASCTLPGIFDPLVWGNRTLVDGGILSQVPLASLKKFNPDIAIGINMRGTKYIFSNKLITFRKVFNFFKHIFFIDRFENFVAESMAGDGETDHTEARIGTFSVIGKSLDIVIKAIKEEEKRQDETCDLMIIPQTPYEKRSEFTKKISQFYYEEGRKYGLEFLPQIQEVIKQRQKEALAV